MKTANRVQKNFQLTERAVKALNKLAADWDCSQSQVINRLLLESPHSHQLRDYQQATIDMVAERIKGA